MVVVAVLNVVPAEDLDLAYVGILLPLSEVRGVSRGSEGDGRRESRLS